jgi:hypothetical protein
MYNSSNLLELYPSVVKEDNPSLQGKRTPVVLGIVSSEVRVNSEE